ncbi:MULTISPECIES: hypothetical protein [Flavobacterium]|uniref:Carboxypeptidase regulatory-like domain-containing protein n=2 Tax=Flavobacterium TaxID=237 RepID=A0ABP7UTN5_9FLAO
MKRIISLYIFLISTAIFAQVPQGISYQAIALNNSGNPVVSSNVGIRLSILNNSATGTVLYTETHTKTTNAQGLFNLVIGQGTPTTGTFNTINWSANAKFLKVEMDVAGGTSYVLVGTTQLLSVPYALAADSLITSPGEGITLVSPNGTPYQLTVNDSGQLSLPTSSASGTGPNSLYMYGSFNSFNASNALQFQISTYLGSIFYGYKYLTAGTQLKFLPANNSSAQVLGLNGSLNLTPNGNSYTVASSGFYLVGLGDEQSPHNISDYTFFISDGVPQISIQGSFVNPSQISYNVATNTISYFFNGITNQNGSFYFDVPIPFASGSELMGDQFNDGTLDLAASSSVINFPGANSIPKNYRIDLILNFNGSGTYTITQL